MSFSSQSQHLQMLSMPLKIRDDSPEIKQSLLVVRFPILQMAICLNEILVSCIYQKIVLPVKRPRKRIYYV